MAKPAVPLAGRPILHWVLDWIGLLEPVPAIAINSHHAPGTLSEAAASHRYPAGHPRAGEAAIVTVHHEQVLLGSGGGLSHLSACLPDGTLLVLNGDTYLRANWRALLSAAEGLDPSGAAWLVTEPRVGRHTALDVGEDGVVRALRPPSAGVPHPVFTGCAVLGAALRDALPPADPPWEAVAGFWNQVIGSGRLHAVSIPGLRFMDLGTRADLDAAGAWIGA